MKLIAPDYYRDFRCIAGECRHSCCIGWEIDIDDESFRYYQTVPGEFGRRLRDNISTDGGTPHFVLGEGERCPFLDSGGLCEMYRTLGEDRLCQICADHPRYRNYFAAADGESDVICEIGPGLCCEAAGRLILGREEKTALVVLEDDGEEAALSDFDADLLDIRARLIECAQDRSVSVTDREARILSLVGRDIGGDMAQWAEFYLGLERLDEKWGEMLSALVDGKCGTDLLMPHSETALEQLLVYFLYRHIPAAGDYNGIASAAAFAVLSERMIRALVRFCPSHGGTDTIVETARMYSSEIEYSEENTAAILDAIG